MDKQEYHNTKFPFSSSFSAELRGIKVHDPRSDDDGGAEAGAVPLPAHTLLVIQFHHQVLDSGREEQVGKGHGYHVFSLALKGCTNYVLF